MYLGMITHISNIKQPPWGLRPYTIKGAVASLVEPLNPGDSVVIGGIITLAGHRLAPKDIRAALNAVTPRGRRYITRVVQGEHMRVWREY